MDTDNGNEGPRSNSFQIRPLERPRRNWFRIILLVFLGLGSGCLLVVLTLIGGLFLLVSTCTDYDPDTPDTPANRKVFESKIGFEPPSTVSDIYAFADEWAGDAAYQLSFKTDRATIDRIVATRELKPWDQPYDTPTPLYEFPWFKASDIENLTPWYFEREADYGEYLWYDPERGQAWYMSIKY